MNFDVMIYWLGVGAFLVFMVRLLDAVLVLAARLVGWLLYWLKRPRCSCAGPERPVVDVVGNYLPQYATDGSAGVDLRAVDEYCVGAGCTLLVKTGLWMAVPPGYEAQVRPRSGLALKHGITVLNAPGTIDSDYRGEVGVILHNTGVEDYYIWPCDRIAQLVIAPVVRAEFGLVDELDDTERAAGGFGSTGT
jgi:dUTP pyrophosphatase